MSLYVQVPIQQIADGLTAIGWSSAGGGGDATLSYGSTVPATPVNGTLWYDTTATLLKLYTGGTWTTINVSAETIATISGYVTLAQSAANDAEQKLTEFKAIQVTAATLSAGASATASFNSGTGVITLGIPTGETGQGLSPKGTDTVANILLKSGVLGDYWIASDTGDGYMHTGSAWANVGAVRGPQGLQGIQGLQGLKGDTGDVTLAQLNAKQDTLVSGTNIKTIGGASILGDGDMVVGGATDYQEFTTSGTWTKPEGINCVYVEAIGGGAGACPTAGGGGGAFNSKFILSSSLPSTVTVTVGAGGTGTSTANTTTSGGNSTFDIYLKAQGGYGGNFASPFTLGMGGGGEAMSTINTNGGSSGSFSSGAGGYTNTVRAGNCVKGGAGGSGYNGGVYSPAGVSTDGGNGGSNGADGSVPGGGGSAKATTGANGANGRVRVWAW